MRQETQFDYSYEFTQCEKSLIRKFEEERVDDEVGLFQLEQYEIMEEMKIGSCWLSKLVLVNGKLNSRSTLTVLSRYHLNPKRNCKNSRLKTDF